MLKKIKNLSTSAAACCHLNKDFHRRRNRSRYVLETIRVGEIIQLPAYTAEIEYGMNVVLFSVNLKPSK